MLASYRATVELANDKFTFHMISLTKEASFHLKKEASFHLKKEASFVRF
jgi:hypothetical protein